jgi:hypothetical protein
VREYVGEKKQERLKTVGELDGRECSQSPDLAAPIGGKKRRWGRKRPLEPFFVRATLVVVKCHNQREKSTGEGSSKKES